MLPGRQRWVNRFDPAWEYPQFGDRTYEIDPSDGTVLRSFTPPAATAPHPSGLAYDGEFLWLTQYTDGVLFQVDIRSPEVHSVEISSSTQVSANQDFGAFQLGSISGTVSDATTRTSSVGLEGWRI